MDKVWYKIYFGAEAERIEGYRDKLDRVFIVADYPCDEHNCDQMGCASMGPHILAAYLNANKYHSLQAEKEAVKTQYARDLVATNWAYFPKPVCKNQPPEITNGYNACLSCPMRKTCLLIFKKP